VLVRADPVGGCLITNTGTSTFMFRKRDTRFMVFKDLVFSANMNGKPFYEDTDADNSIFIADNCTVANANTGAGAGCYIRSDGFPARNRHIEFKNCTLSHRSSSSPIITLGNNHGPTTTFLITGGSLDATTAPAIVMGSYTGGCSIYGTEIKQNSNTYILQLGSDTTAPTANLGLIDIRACDIKYVGAAYGHAVLLGRGTVQYYFVNNKVTCPNSNQVSNINAAIKTTSTDLANAVFKGNWLIGCRPFLIKGATYNDVQYNVIINNQAAFYPTTFINTNEAGTELLSRYNRFERNSIYGLQRVVDVVFIAALIFDT